MLTRAGRSSLAGAHLTEAQERAVARRGESLLLAAGAGSGKTSVLVERFARAVIDDGIAPARILAITFTERAAAELRERVAARLRDAGEHAAANELEGAFIGTFHGYCARVLRAHGALAGISSEFAILEERLAGWLRAQAFTRALHELLAGERADAVDLVAAYGAERVRAMTLEAYATLRSKGERRPRLPSPRAAPAPGGAVTPAPGAAIAGAPDGADAGGASLDAVRACAILAELLERFGRTYEELKRRRCALDFDDLELIARELLEQHEDVRAATAARFDLLMVDEFQDCNARELAIVEALERDNLFTVGDERQAIYGFRHADVSLFTARRVALEDVGASLRLSDNFRSHAEILEFVNGVFSARFGEPFEQLVAARDDGEGQDEAAPAGNEARALTLFDAGAEPRVELLLTAKRGWEANERATLQRQLAATRATAPWRVAEARALARRVHELVRDGEARAGEIAVLLRALGDCETYEAALRECGLRTVAPAGSFWSREQVCDLVAYLRALANPLDDLALFSTLASPLVGVSRGALARLARAARARRRRVWEELCDGGEELRAQLSDEDGEALLEFADRLARERASARRRSISRVLERALDWSGYREHVLAQADGARRLANVHKLLAIACEFEQREGRDVRSFLEYVNALANGAGAPESEAPVAAQGDDAVTLLSIHAAKGLEFPVVCVADLGRAQNLSVPDLLVDGERVGLRLASLERDDVAPALEFAQLATERRRAQAEEEDRILYVAMTRARDRLVLSGALDLERPPRPREDEPPIAWLVRAIDADRSETGLRQLVRRSVNEPGRAEAPGSPALEVRSTEDDAVGAFRVQGGGEWQAAPAAVDAHAARASVRSHPSAGAVEPAPRGSIGALSYTALAELERCSYRYYLERTLGLAERRAPAASVETAAPLADEGASRARARARGMLVHRVLETAHAAGAETASRPADGEVHRVLETAETARVETAGARHAEIATAAKQLGIATTRAEREEVAWLVGRARAPEGLFARLGDAASVHREQPFAFVLGERETLITGVMDVVAYERGDRVLIVDYKTDRVAEQADVEELVESEYSLQRLIYALALLRAGAAEVEIVHWFLEREDGCATARFAASERELLEGRLGERVERALERGFVPSDDPHRGLCATCPGRGGLCRWSDAEALRDEPRGSPPVRASAGAKKAEMAA